jgi:hypothetical protein
VTVSHARPRIARLLGSRDHEVAVEGEHLGGDRPCSAQELAGPAGDRRDRWRLAGFVLDYLGEDDLPAAGS